MEKRKIVIIFTLIVIAIAAIAIVLPFAKNYFTGKIAEKPQLTIEPNPFADHPMLFYATVEFNPETHFVTQHKVGTVNGDLPFFAATPPAPNPQSFQYRVEVTTEDGVILSTGWVEDRIDLIKTENGNYLFTLYTKNEPDAFVRIYLSDDTLIWTGKIE